MKEGNYEKLVGWMRKNEAKQISKTTHPDSIITQWVVTIDVTHLVLVVETRLDEDGNIENYKIVETIVK